MDVPAIRKPAVPAPAAPAARRTRAAATPADPGLAERQAAFDRMLAERAELDREANAIRDLTMAQLKRDDETLKAWIRLI